jgi:hypothetical protein
LAKALGYDPDSFLSMQAFKAKGYQHNDTTDAASKWDAANPNGLFGWDGATAATEAEVFAADPKKYLQNIANNKSLSPEDAAAKLQAVSSQQFQDLVKRVNGDRADIGADVASGLGIDPVKHSTTFNIVSTGTNLAAQFAADPIAFGLSAYRAQQVASVSIGGLTDAGGILRILKPEDLGRTTVAQRRSIRNLQDMVDGANDFRVATEAGDTVKAAQVQAKLSTNPFAGLLATSLGTTRSSAPCRSMSLPRRGRARLPFRTGKAEPITTYEDAANYLASSAALLRLQGGYAPVLTSVMPGAMSSYGYMKVKGSLSAWSAGRTAQKAENAAGRLIESAKADPGKLARLLDDGMLTRTLPGDSDAIDVLTGRVLAAESRAAANAPCTRGSRPATTARWSR